MVFLSSLGFHAIPQPTRFFPLPGGGSYTPDFLAWDEKYSFLISVEVKGGYHGPGFEQGYERYKRTAQIYDGIHFRFVMMTQDSKSKSWSLEWWGERPAGLLGTTTENGEKLGERNEPLQTGTDLVL